jgi:methylmalonyl-CoA/ethylmalonyl-CoA epimerase
MKLDHIGIAVKDLDWARKFYGETLGFRVSEPEELPERKLRICFVEVGDARVELLFPTSPDSTVAKFLASRGQGVHHLCYEVEDLEAKIKAMKAAGAKMIDEKPRPGTHGTVVAFVHPESAGGVLTEFCQHLP